MNSTEITELIDIHLPSVFFDKFYVGTHCSLSLTSPFFPFKTNLRLNVSGLNFCGLSVVDSYAYLFHQRFAIHLLVRAGDNVLPAIVSHFGRQEIEIDIEIDSVQLPTSYSWELDGVRVYLKRPVFELNNVPAYKNCLLIVFSTLEYREMFILPEL
jgi:hypothetical protein